MDARRLLHRSTVATLNRLARTPRSARALFAMIAFHDHWSENLSEEARFLAFCGSLRPLAHGQILQDLWALFELNLKTDGYFVEFGAYDGTAHSNTKLLEDRFGWKGLLVEPNLNMVGALREERKGPIDPRCVWDTSGDEIKLLITGDPELSTVAEHASEDLHTVARRSTAVREIAVPTVTLDDILDEYAAPARIDFMSVDTEGTELKILQAFSFVKHVPTLVAVEHNGREEAQRDLDAIMISHGYERRFRAMSDWDAWYRLR